MKLKLIKNLRSPLESGLSAGTPAKNRASSPAEKTSAQRSSPWAQITAYRGRKLQIFAFLAIPHPSRWDHRWKKAVPSETMPCQVASDPMRKTCASNHPKSLWLLDTPAAHRGNPGATYSLDQTLQNGTALPAWIMFMPRAWYTKLPSVQSSSLRSDWRICPNNSKVMQRPWPALTEYLTRSSEFHYPYNPLQGRPRQESPSLVVFFLSPYPHTAIPHWYLVGTPQYPSYIF